MRLLKIKGIHKTRGFKTQKPIDEYRKTIGGILGQSGVSYASGIGLNYFKENSTESRGRLVAHVDFMAEV